MTRIPSLIAACALALVFCAPGRGQDSPSLGDLARQAQKDKANKPPAKVITNDDVASGSGDISSSLGSSTGSAQTAQPGAPGKTGDPGSPAVGFEKLQTLLDQLDSLDAATLATNVLQGNEANFTGRSRWEAKLYAAKQTFVAESRSVLERARQLQATAEGMKSIQDPNDPRAKGVIAKLQQLVQEGQQDSAAFQAVMSEGKNLAADAAAH